MARKSILADLIAKEPDPDFDPETDEGSWAPSSLPVRPEAPHAAPTRPKEDFADRVHTSIYLPRDLRRELRQIAAAEECKVHDLLIEGIRHVIHQRRRQRS